MTTHLYTRLVWHDRAWDGHICDHPGLNTYCVVHQHIRDSRDDEREDKAAGTPLAVVQEESWQPPCSRDPIAFSKVGYTITHNDPLEFRRLPSVQEDIPPYSVCPSTYRWMREENFRIICEDEKLDIRESDTKGKEFGWVFEPDRQIELLRSFWGKLEKERSLVFFYCNHGNPLDERLNRILLGISYDYEKKLEAKGDPSDFRLPDFTVSYEGDTYYWEHLGMLSVPSYKEQWERKRQWYEDNGHLDRLITSEDGPDGSLNVGEIERSARKRIIETGEGG